MVERVALRAYPAGLHQPRHAHDFTTVSFVVRGAIRERAEGKEELAYALSVVVKPAGVPHEDEFGPAGARTLQIVAMGAPALERWRWIHGGPIIHAFVRLLDTHPRDRESASFDVLSHLGDAAAQRGSPPRWLARIREELDDTIEQSPRVSALAAGAQVHPVYLAREFRRAFGCSITEYIQRRRVELAASLIADTRSLANVAQAAGFADQSHLCRSFRRATGLTPSAYRRLAK